MTIRRVIALVKYRRDALQAREHQPLDQLTVSINEFASIDFY